MMFLLFALSACDDAPSGGTINGQPATAVARPAPKPYDPIAVAAKAEAYVSQLYGSKSPNGPVCFPEAMQGDSTQCSFTYLEGTVLQAGTITCSSRGCVSGEIKPVPVEDTPQVVVQSGNHDNNEWLYWYLLYNNGGTSVHYNTWYTTTPAVGRTSYTSTSYTPPAASTSYYRSTYRAPVTTTVTAKTAARAPTASTSSAKSTSTTTTTKSTSTSTGWGKSTRSTGYKSSGGSSRSGGRR